MWFKKTNCLFAKSIQQTMTSGTGSTSQEKVTFGHFQQTSSDKDTESPDSSVSFLSGRTDRQRTAFLKSRTESGKQTDTGLDFPENRDKNQTRTGHGHRCPPTSDVYGP